MDLLLGSRARVGVSMEDLPTAASLPCAQDEPACAKSLPGGIIPVFLVLQQDLAARFLSLGSPLAGNIGVQVLQALG